MAKILNKLSHSYFGLQNHGFDPGLSIKNNRSTLDPVFSKKSESIVEPLQSSQQEEIPARSTNLPESEKLIFLNKIKLLADQNHKFAEDLKQSKFSLGQLQQQLIQQHQIIKAQEKEIALLSTAQQSFDHLQLEQEIEQNKHFKIIELLKTQVAQQKKIIHNLTEQNQKLNYRVQSLEQQDAKLQHQIFEQTEMLQNKEQAVTELTQTLDQTTHLLKIAQKRQTQILSQVENLLV